MPHPGENPTRPDGTPYTPADPINASTNPARLWDVTINQFGDTRLDSFPSLQRDGDEKYLYRGFMKSAFPDNKNTAWSGATQYGLYFRYNPSSISVSHSIQGSNPVLPQSYLPPQDTGRLLAMTGGSLGFDLLFAQYHNTRNDLLAVFFDHESHAKLWRSWKKLTEQEHHQVFGFCHRNKMLTADSDIAA